MKLKYILPAIAAVALTGCLDNDFAEGYNEGSKTFADLELTAGTDAVVLEEANHAATAFTLEWTTGNNYGTGKRINYTLDIVDAASGRVFSPIANATQTYSWAPSVETLNNIAVNNLGIAAGSDAEIEAIVYADVEGCEQQVASTTFALTTYKEVTRTLYIIGSAAPNGWSADNASEMRRLDNGQFMWEGNLSAGEFKFIVNLGEFLPSYNNNGAGKLVYRDSDSQPDDKFIVEEAHFYKVTVDLLSLTLTMVQEEGVKPAFESLYFIGNESDWNFWPLTVDPLDPFLFRKGIFFSKGGEFKFATTDGSWENNFKATVANAPYTDQSTVLVKGFEPDLKWFLKDDETNKAYKICFDIRTGAEKMMMRLFTPYTEMYLVGDATPNGWDLGNATPMTVDPNDPNVFTWTGNLSAGELKFSADKKSDWNGAWFMAYSPNAAPTGTVEKTLFIDKSDDALKAQYPDIEIGAVDYKWKIETPGEYTITLNQLLEEVTIKAK